MVRYRNRKRRAAGAYHVGRKVAAAASRAVSRKRRRIGRSTGPQKIQTHGIVRMARHSFLPVSRKAVLRYSETFTLTTGTGGLFGTDQVMRLNSLYDPDFTGGGHQPYLYDQITPLYASYRVYAAKVTLIGATIGGTADLCYAVKYSTDSGGSGLAAKSIDTITETTNSVQQYLSPSGNKRVSKQTMYFPMAALFGVSKKAYQIDDKYQSATNTNPGETAYLYISVGSPNGTSGETMTLQVVIDFYAKFFNRIDQAPS